MRHLVGWIIPLVLQLLAYVGVFIAARGGGSFMGLLAMPVAALTVPSLILIGSSGARSRRPLTRLAMVTYGLALGPPVLLLLFRALEG